MIFNDTLPIDDSDNSSPILMMIFIRWLSVLFIPFGDDDDDYSSIYLMMMIIRLLMIFIHCIHSWWWWWWLRWRLTLHSVFRAMMTVMKPFYSFYSDIWLFSTSGDYSGDIVLFIDCCLRYSGIPLFLMYVVSDTLFIERNIPVILFDYSYIEYLFREAIHYSFVLTSEKYYYSMILLFPMILFIVNVYSKEELCESIVKKAVFIQYLLFVFNDRRSDMTIDISIIPSYSIEGWERVFEEKVLIFSNVINDILFILLLCYCDIDVVFSNIVTDIEIDQYWPIMMTYWLTWWPVIYSVFNREVFWYSVVFGIYSFH